MRWLIELGTTRSLNWDTSSNGKNRQTIHMRNCTRRVLCRILRVLSTSRRLPAQCPLPLVMPGSA